MDTDGLMVFRVAGRDERGLVTWLEKRVGRPHTKPRPAPVAPSGVYYRTAPRRNVRRRAGCLLWALLCLAAGAAGAAAMMMNGTGS